MAIDLLDTPLRATWDLHDGSGSPADAATVRRVAAEFVAAGVLFVSAQRQPLRHPDIGEALALLRRGGCRTAVHCAGTDAELAAVAGRPPIDSLLLDLQPFIAATVDWNRLTGCLAALRQNGFEPALSLVPDRRSLPLVPELLAFCRTAGVGRFKLPNTPLGASFDSPAGGRLRPEDVEAFRRTIGNDPAALHAGITLEVHDLFLWEILFPGRQEGRSEYGGCQAANSLAHVDAAGVLYPCSSWPQPLGSLQRQALADLWQSPARLQVRSDIAGVPAGCDGCCDYLLCLGGCRGLGRYCNPQDGCRDPLCPAPRTRKDP